MLTKFSKLVIVGTLALTGACSGGGLVEEESGSTTVQQGIHAWGDYHWARTANPFILKIGDNVNTTWDPYLLEAITDWSASSVLDLTRVAGTTSPRTCKATAGQIAVCNASYGSNGWLGIASVWASGSHITQATAKMNDTYFNTAKYNTPAWRRLVMCQELAHDFGLNHQDELFDNPNLGSCMDYTSNPLGPPSNEHPNFHDFEELETIYAHLDPTTTISASLPSSAAFQGNGVAAGHIIDGEDVGQPFNESEGDTHYIKKLGPDTYRLTAVIWAAP